MKNSSKEIIKEHLEISTKPGEMASQIQKLVETLQKNKKDILALKAMLLTGIILLMGGFFYYNNTVQQIRMQALDANFHLRQSQGDLNTMAVQKGIFQEIQSLKTAVDSLARKNAAGNGNYVEQAVVGMNNTLTLLRDEPSKVRELTLQVQRTSREFLKSYQTHNISTSNK